MELTFREAVRRALIEEMDRDERVFIMGEDVGAYGGSYAVTKGLLERFGPERVRDTPISEAAILGAGTGAAMGGLRPVVEIMTINFLLPAADQLINGAAKFHYMFNGQFSVPLVVRTVNGGRRLAATHSQDLEVLFAFIPGLKVAAPASPADAHGMLKAAIRDPDPVLFVEHALLYSVKGEVPDDPDHLVPLGRSTVRRPGRDVTLVAYSRAVALALEAANVLADRGVEAEVIDLRSLRPLDAGPVLESVRKTHRAVVVEEDWKTYGVGAELSARIAEEAFDALAGPILRVAGSEVPMPYAANLEQLALPQVEQVVDAVASLMGRRGDVVWQAR
ncbi:alpha-ketoacid dehydrogenase subunit beta [Limnochorda pilosa]|uniref:Pyruvate dehydrogenase n=1 Tax=Limnochorda pilosa TaxID=1555112 RepID=A0A0K2SG26_LIMPI|nr:alpha-ketoacid dehydrogenase subunit beta [Limnochorda pilosa]BAS26058.1 pyruvate dehydrogenase [Limnochorda pilosa]